MTKPETTKGVNELATEAAQKFIDIHGRYMNLHINDILPEYKELAKAAYVAGYQRGTKEAGPGDFG